MRQSGRASRSWPAAQQTCASAKQTTPQRNSIDARGAPLTARNQSPAPAATNPASIHNRRQENQRMPQRPPMMSEPNVEMGVVSR